MHDITLVDPLRSLYQIKLYKVSYLVKLRPFLKEFLTETE
jgi:hypothetical protein